MVCELILSSDLTRLKMARSRAITPASIPALFARSCTGKPFPLTPRRVNETSMAYDNKRYWENLHQEHAGRLRAVGHPWLTEKYNELKYASEAETLRTALAELKPAFTQKTI